MSMGGVIDNLAIVDYKTATGPKFALSSCRYTLTLNRREGAVGAAFINDMSTATRRSADITDRIDTKGRETGYRCQLLFKNAIPAAPRRRKSVRRAM